MTLIEVKNYAVDPSNIIPPHGLARPEMFEKIRKSMEKNGWKGRRIIAVTDRNMGGMIRALTGSHRIAAAGFCGIDIPVHLLKFDAIDQINLVTILAWDCGYLEMGNWLKKFDRSAARTFDYDIRWAKDMDLI